MNSSERSGNVTVVSTLHANKERQLFIEVFDKNYDALFDFHARVEGSNQRAEVVSTRVMEQFQLDLYGGIYFNRSDLRVHLYRTAVAIPESTEIVPRELYPNYSQFERSVRQILALKYGVGLTDAEIGAVVRKKPKEIKAMIDDIKSRTILPT